VIELRPMQADDLVDLERWLGEPHVARWWRHTTPAEEFQKLSARVAGTRDPAIRMLTILERGSGAAGAVARIGWCQWYPCGALPPGPAALGARAGDCGIDYAIGEPAAIGRGLGIQLIAALVAEIRRHHPGAGVIADPDAANLASRRVLERNGFSLVALRAIAGERQDLPVAVYRLDGAAHPTEVAR
jgi:aminoglycoside 6'-N-acetyltransferase